MLLRTALRNYLNGVNADAIKKRFFIQRKASDALNAIKTEESHLEKVSVVSKAF